MAYLFSDLVDDLNALRGRRLAGLTGESDPYSMVSANRDGTFVVRPSGAGDVTWRGDKVSGIFSIISRGYACHVDRFLAGSGSRRASLRDALANTPHIFFINKGGLTCIALAEDREHALGETAWLRGSDAAAIPFWEGGSSIPSVPASQAGTTSPTMVGNELAVVLYGPPGTGKTYASMSMAVDFTDGVGAESRPKQLELYRERLREGRIAFVTFHQSYSYEDFVEGIFPDLEHDQLRYVRRDGVLKEIAERALQNGDKKYAIVIDEINRGNISKILGELITVLESDRRAGAAEETTVLLQYSRKPFALPSNLKIIGTMNTADRSLVRIDYALRRRFEFIEVAANPSMLDEIDAGAEIIDVSKLVSAMNIRLTNLIGREKAIGHAYFLGADSLKKLGSVFQRKIVPLLEEYFVDDLSSAAHVLGDDIKEDPQDCFLLEVGAGSIDGVQHFTVNEAAFARASAYQAIYGEKAEQLDEDAA